MVCELECAPPPITEFATPLITIDLKEINCAEPEYMNSPRLPPNYRVGYTPLPKLVNSVKSKSKILIKFFYINYFVDNIQIQVFNLDEQENV